MIPKTLLRAAVAFMLGAVLAACSNLGLDAADDQAARRAYAQIRDNDRAGLDGWAGPEMKKMDAATWEAIRSIIPPQQPQSVAVTGWKYNVSTASGNVLETVHEYDYPDRKVKAETVLQRIGTKGAWTVIGFHVKGEAKAPAADAGAARTGRADS